MGELLPEDFPHYFEALWGHRPFAWQQRLADRVVMNEDAPWPQAIALPTAAGKTACLDIAVFALATQAQRLRCGKVITAPRRVFFVVDRRVIVDEAYERARTVARKLEGATGGILKTVANALRTVAHGAISSEGESRLPPLAVYALRGGIYRSEAWANSPLQPAVIASTVDQIGSRLLFRAYGRGFGMWPVYAGLTANDSLILLDEAHCAQPFLQTLQAVNRYHDWAEQPLGRRFYPVVMSATPPESATDRFEDTSAERQNPIHPLGQRQLARKPTTLIEISNARGAKATQNLAKALVKRAEELADERGRAVVIFVNRVATARAARDLLRTKHGDRAVLLTGRMRSIDKDAVVKEQLKPLSSAHSSSRNLEQPHFVVATQTLEVGADLDFDALVSECASLDALRQRFGRLNRMGRPIEARATIMVRGDQAAGSNDDPVYGSALASTWVWLNEHTDDAGQIDFGIAHLNPMLPEGEALLSLNAPSVQAPVMLPAHVDCWAQTAPEPKPSPDVSLFLHGPREGAADVQVCWRINLDLDALSLCPPASNEVLPVPIGVFRRWLAGEFDQDDSTDVEGAEDDASSLSAKNREQKQIESVNRRQVLRWRARDTQPDDLTSDPNAIRPGDIIVLPVNAPDAMALGDLPADGATKPGMLDISERAYRLARAKPLLRLHSDLIATWADGPAKTKAEELCQLSNEDPDLLLASVRDLLQSLADPENTSSVPEWRTQAARELLREAKHSRFIRSVRYLDDGSFIITGQSLIPKLTRQADTFSDEDDSTASGISRPNGQPVRLLDHLPGVAGFARRFAVGCGLPDALVHAVERAGLLHDLGKADPRFQAMLHGGSPWAISQEPLAKSGAMPKTPQAARAARERAGYPQGGRHELLSVRLAESAPGVLPDDPEMRDLVLHLVASHHGHCRPFAPVVFDERPPAVSIELAGQTMHWCSATGLELLDSGVAERYWRLVRRYGWWGLAWLEALLRLADHRRSEWEETHSHEH